MHNYSRDHDQIEAAFKKGMITPYDFAAYTEIRTKEDKIAKAHESGSISNSVLNNAIENADQWSWEKTNRDGMVRFELVVKVGKDSVFKKAKESQPLIQKTVVIPKPNPPGLYQAKNQAEAAEIKKAIATGFAKAAADMKIQANAIVDLANSITKGKKLERLK